MTEDRGSWEDPKTSHPRLTGVIVVAIMSLVVFAALELFMPGLFGTLGQQARDVFGL